MTDPYEQFMEVGRRIYGPNFGYQYLKNIFDFPVASDTELVMHYLRGGGGPFIDLKVYTELGVGWNLKAEGFEDEDEGLKAVKLVEDEFKKRDFYTSLIQLATFRRVLGRAALIKTYTLNGTFYYNEKEKTTGLDVINPMTLEMESIRRVMSDKTGDAQYKQQVSLVDGGSDTIEFEQDRVIYITNNNMNRYSVTGTSDMEKALTDLRTLARFPFYRDEMGAIYSTLLLLITTDAEKIAKTEFGQKLRESVTNAQKYLDDTAEFYRQMRGKGNIIANYSWEDVNPVSFAGREVRLPELERATIESTAFKMEVPINLLMFGKDVNRDTLETLADVFVSRMEKGARKFVFTPIIESTANEILQQNGILEGRLTVEYNPFLSKNLLEAAEILGKVWPTGAISKPEVRQKLDLPAEINLGGDEWSELNPMPEPVLKLPMGGELGKSIQTEFNLKNKKIRKEDEFRRVNSYLERKGLVKQLY